MSTATAVRFQSVPSPVRAFQSKRHGIVSVVFVAAHVAFFVGSYLVGRHYWGYNVFNPVFYIPCSFLILYPMVLIGTVKGLACIARKQAPAKNLLLLAAPAAALFALTAFPVPSFEKGVAASLRNDTTANELVSFARSTAQSPPSWMKEQGDGRRWGGVKASWLRSTPPFDRLKNLSPPWMTIERRVVSLSWGGALAENWGIAISTEPGLKPQLPEGASGATQAFPEVWVFSLPSS